MSPYVCFSPQQQIMTHIVFPTTCILYMNMSVECYGNTLVLIIDFSPSILPSNAIALSTFQITSYGVVGTGNLMLWNLQGQIT